MSTSGFEPTPPFAVHYFGKYHVVVAEGAERGERLTPVSARPPGLERSVGSPGNHRALCLRSRPCALEGVCDGARAAPSRTSLLLFLLVLRSSSSAPPPPPAALLLLLVSPLLLTHSSLISPALPKDNYWSTADQLGQSHYKSHPREPYSRLQAAVATISKGPVAPSDKIGHSDVALIMRSCASDGTLLQPGRPATKLDSFLLAEALSHSTPPHPQAHQLHAGEAPQLHPTGEVWAADTTVSGRTFSLVFAANLSAAYSLSARELGYAAATQLVATEVNASVGGATSFVRFGHLMASGNSVGNSSRDADVSASSVSSSPASARAAFHPTPASGDVPLQLRANGVFDFSLWNVAPVERNGWALLGEVAGKWVGVSQARVTSVSSGSRTSLTAASAAAATSTWLEATVKGSGGEVLEFAFAPPPKHQAMVKKAAPHQMTWPHAPEMEQAQVVRCVLPAHGVATLRVPDGSCA